MMMMVPTSTIPWMALLPDISGVCRMLGTALMTSITDEGGQHEDGQKLENSGAHDSVS